MNLAMEMTLRFHFDPFDDESKEPNKTRHQNDGTLSIPAGPTHRKATLEKGNSKLLPVCVDRILQQWRYICY